MDEATARPTAHATCAAMLAAVLRPDSPIYARVQSGICAALAAGLAAGLAAPAAMAESPAGKDVRNATVGVREAERARLQGVLAAELAPVGAAALVEEVADWVGQVRLVLELSWAVCGPWYEALWAGRALLAEE